METQGRCDAATSGRSYSSTFWAMRYVMLFENSTTLRRPYAHALFAYALALYQPNSDATNRVLSRYGYFMIKKVFGLSKFCVK